MGISSKCIGTFTARETINVSDVKEANAVAFAVMQMHAVVVQTAQVGCSDAGKEKF